MLLTPGQRLGRYEILGKLGEGGMGVVYKARDLDLKRPVAIKVLPPESVRDNERTQRFIQEARTASALNHPGIVTIYEIAKHAEVDYIAMEFIDGSNFADLIVRQKLSLKEILTYAIQAANALAKAHATGIVHRDLKPSNFMVTNDGHVKVLDFGLAKLLDPVEPDLDPSADTLTAPKNLVDTAAGSVVGTVAYMSPEQAEGKKLDARSDIFSFGIVLYEMVTGVRAFQRASQVQTLAAIVNAEPVPPSQLRKDLPRDLERIILRCLRKDPARRHQVMADLAVELDDVKTESGKRLAAAPANTATPSRRWLAAAAVGLAVAAGGTWWLWPRDGLPAPSSEMTQLTAFANNERFPSISPDGNQVAFSWAGEKGDNEDIYIIPIGVGTPTRITTDPAIDRFPAWSPDGSRLAFVRVGVAENSIFVTPPVPNAEKPIGRIVLPKTGNPGFSTSASWFPDGERLAVSASEPEGRMQGIVAMDINGGEPKRIIWNDLPNGSYVYPAVSPDGKALAYYRCTANFSCDVYVVGIDRDLKVSDEPQKLTRTSAIPSGVTWAADGRSVIYGRQAEYMSYLWRARLDRSEPERIDLAGDQAYNPSVSARGGLLAFQQNNGNSNIWRFTPTGEREDFVYTRRHEGSPQFSPDGKHVAFESNRLGRLQIWTANADGSSPRPLTAPGLVAQGSPRWSPDGLSIAYDERLPAGPLGVFVIAADGSGSRFLTTGSVPFWSRDGHIYFNRSEGIWRIPATGGKDEQIVSVGYSPVASPDGATLYYRKRTAPSALFAVSRTGGTEREVLSSVAPGGWQVVPVEDGIYFAQVPSSRPQWREICFFDLATRQTKTLFSFEVQGGSGLAVSPDRRTFLYSGSLASDGDDLKLIRNFQ